MIIEKEFEIKSLTDFIGKIESLDYYDNYLYRGEQQDYELSLTPKIGRIFHDINFKGKELFFKLETQLLNWFKVESVQYIDKIPNNDFEFLILGQQYGLATRMLDFTKNPLVALYFSVYDEDNSTDGFVYIIDEMLWDISKFDIDLTKFIDLPKKIKEHSAFIPPRISQRISKQSSVLVFFPDPTIQYDKEVIRFRIDKSNKKRIKAYLHKMNIDKNFLFHTLDSLTETLNYKKFDFTHNL